LSEAKPSGCDRPEAGHLARECGRDARTGTPLEPAFYGRPVVEVARDLVGCAVSHGGASGVIVETEAYHESEPACHAFAGLTARTEVLFGPPGRAYVYLIYGMYHCFNVVTDADGVGAAVLVRAVEPVEGLPEKARTDGPGRLCRTLGLTLAHNRWDLQDAALHLTPGVPVPEAQVERGPRIGVDYAGEWSREPYRLWIRGSQHVSRPPARRRPEGA
jgi:DNA-3-methyladenine glycosylase